MTSRHRLFATGEQSFVETQSFVRQSLNRCRVGGDNSDWNSSQVVSRWTTSNGNGPLAVQRRRTNRYRWMMMMTMVICPPNSIGKVAGIHFRMLCDSVVVGCIFGRFLIPKRRKNWLDFCKNKQTS